MLKLGQSYKTVGGGSVRFIALYEDTDYDGNPKGAERLVGEIGAAREHNYDPETGKVVGYKAHMDDVDMVDAKLAPCIEDAPAAYTRGYKHGYEAAKRDSATTEKEARKDQKVAGVIDRDGFIFWAEKEARTPGKDTGSWVSKVDEQAFLDALDGAPKAKLTETETEAQAKEPPEWGWPELPGMTNWAVISRSAGKTSRVIGHFPDRSGAEHHAAARNSNKSDDISEVARLLHINGDARIVVKDNFTFTEDLEEASDYGLWYITDETGKTLRYRRTLESAYGCLQSVYRNGLKAYSARLGRATRRHLASMDRDAAEFIGSL